MNVLLSVLVGVIQWNAGALTFHSRMHRPTAFQTLEDSTVQVTAQPQKPAEALVWTTIDSVPTLDTTQTLQLEFQGLTPGVHLRIGIFFQVQGSQDYYTIDRTVLLDTTWSTIEIPLREATKVFGSNFPHALSMFGNADLILIFSNPMAEPFVWKIRTISLVPSKS